VNHLSRPWRRPVLRVLVLAMALAAAPLPAVAGEPNPLANPSPLKASIETAVAKEMVAVAKAPNARLARSSGSGTTTDLGTPSFFKTPAGVITLVLTTAGLGYAIYSTNHDRVKSPAK
jgi:hypothetical protein